MFRAHRALAMLSLSCAARFILPDVADLPPVALLATMMLSTVAVIAGALASHDAPSVQAR